MLLLPLWAIRTVGNGASVSACGPVYGVVDPVKAVEDVLLCHPKVRNVAPGGKVQKFRVRDIVAASQSARQPGLV
jgi:hypothetical protein